MRPFRSSGVQPRSAHRSRSVDDTRGTSPSALRLRHHRRASARRRHRHARAAAAAGAQTAQNEPGAIQAAAPRAGAPMSFADMVAKLQPAVVNISTKQTIVQQQQANPFAGTPFERPVRRAAGRQGGAPVTREAQSLGLGLHHLGRRLCRHQQPRVAPGARGATVDSITVTLPDRKEYTAKLIGRDAGVRSGAAQDRRRPACRSSASAIRRARGSATG